MYNYNNSTISNIIKKFAYLIKTERMLILLSVAILLIAIVPEPNAKLLTTEHSKWNYVIKSSKIHTWQIPEQYRQIRRSVINNTNASIFRTWTPDKGVVTLNVVSPLFKASPYMSVLITGTTRTRDGLVQAFIECQSNSQRLKIFKGSVNTNLAEAHVALPRNWCPGMSRIKFSSNEKNINVGVGDVFEISFLSYLKSTFIGRLPYFTSALIIFAFVMFSGTCFMTRMGWYIEPVPLAYISLGFVALGMFYLTSAIPNNWRWTSIILVVVASIYFIRAAGYETCRQVARALAPYARLWFFSSLSYFAIMSLSYNGLGHWEPNYRFWPAIWSSDNELPWIFAEAIRHGWDLKGLFGGGWIPTDRPPLMTGAHLLLSDTFTLLQANNDGHYLRGGAYNAAAIVLNALWIPAAWWLLVKLSRTLDDRARVAILVFVACLPFVLFNTIYGWPKAFGASFALLTFALAWQVRKLDITESKTIIIFIFFIMGTFSMLAHSSIALFLAPLGLLFLVRNLRGNTRDVIIGFGLALSLLLSWSLYKSVVLLSSEPVTKYALTGHLDLGHPGKSLWTMLSTRYEGMSFWQWLEIKKTMLQQVFLPLDNSVSKMHLNSDFGAGIIDKLRAWDFMLLSKGNIAVPFFVVLAAWITIRSLVSRRYEVFYSLGPFIELLAISVVAWLLMVSIFFAPPILHHWPQAALFGLALGGAVVVQQRYPVLFVFSLVISITYTIAVWIISPLWSALEIDIGAALVIAVLISWMLISNFLLSPKVLKTDE